jgi:hypothetical protein
MARIPLNESPDPRLPFHYHLGDRVRIKAGHETGTIVSGVYEGPPPEAGGGAYDVVYEIEVRRGLRFRAQQINLEYESAEEALRAKTRNALRTGILPSDEPPARALRPGEPIPIVMGPGQGRDCALCGEPRADMAFHYPDRTVAFHTSCHDIWREERERL